MNSNNLNLSKSRYERFLSRIRGPRPVVHGVDPLVFLSEEEYVQKRNTGSLNYSYLDNLQKKRKRNGSSMYAENTSVLTNEHINKIARLQRSPRLSSTTENIGVKPIDDKAKQKQTSFVHSDRSVLPQPSYPVSVRRAPLSVRSLNSSHSKESNGTDNSLKEMDKMNKYTGTVLPEVDLSEAKLPEAISPKADLPEAVSPKADILKAVSPKANPSKANPPEASPPEASPPETNPPKANTPKANTPEPDLAELFDKPDKGDAIQGSPNDNISDAGTDFEIEYDYGDDGGVFVGEEERQDLVETSDPAPVPLPSSQRQHQEASPSIAIDNEDGSRASITPEKISEFGRLPTVYQKIFKPGSLMFLEQVVSKLMMNYVTQPPSEEELEIIREKIHGAIPIKLRIRKNKDLTEVLTELGTVTMSCASSITVNEGYHLIILDVVAETIKQHFDNQISLCRLQDELYHKINKIKRVQKKAQERLLGARMKRGKFSETMQLKEKCEELLNEHKVNLDMIDMFNKLKNLGQPQKETRIVEGNQD